MDNKSYKFEIACKSDIGRVRLSNQDAAAIVSNKSGDILILVADGLGGHNKGDYASKTTVNFIKEAFIKSKNFPSIFIAKLWLQYIVGKANKLIFNTSENSSIYKGMGTTLVAALIRKNNVVILNIGDSRAYFFDKNKLTLITDDDSFVNYLKKSGQISKEEADKRKDKNVLMNALGIFPTINFNSKLLKYNNETILLCSDGLFNNVTESEIKELLISNLNINDTANELINKANLNGGSDNITVAIYKRKSK